MINSKNTKNNINKNDNINPREKYKQTSIKNSKYQKPEITYTDKLTKEQIETLLIDFEEIQDIEEVPIGTFIRYFDLIDGELKFRVGGILSVKRPKEGYIYLKNNLINWPVQLNRALLFRKITNAEIKKEYDDKLFKKDLEIAELVSYIKKLTNENNKLKAQINKSKK